MKGNRSEQQKYFDSWGSLRKKGKNFEKFDCRRKFEKKEKKALGQNYGYNSNENALITFWKIELKSTSIENPKQTDYK